MKSRRSGPGVAVGRHQGVRSTSHLRGTFGSPRRRVRPVQDVAHSHSPGYSQPRRGQPVEKLLLCTLSPQVGHQIRQFWGVWCRICGRNELNADFFNRLGCSRKFALRSVRWHHACGGGSWPAEKRVGKEEHLWTSTRRFSTTRSIRPSSPPMSAAHYSPPT